MGDKAVKYYLNLDENNYLLSVSSVGGSGAEADINIDEYDLSGIRINAYKWENGTLIFDEAKYAQLEAEQAQTQDAPTLEEKIAELQEQIELLLSGATQ